MSSPLCGCMLRHASDARASVLTRTTRRKEPACPPNPGPSRAHPAPHVQKQYDTGGGGQAGRLASARSQHMATSHGVLLHALTIDHRCEHLQVAGRHCIGSVGMCQIFCMHIAGAGSWRCAVLITAEWVGPKQPHNSNLSRNSCDAHRSASQRHDAGAVQCNPERT